MPFPQTQTMPPGTNPLRRWLASQPLSVTQSTIARELGVDRSTISRIMHDDSPVLPSLRLASRIENLTRGAVTASALFDYIEQAREVA